MRTQATTIEMNDLQGIFFQPVQITILDQFLVDKGGYVVFAESNNPGKTFIIEGEHIASEILAGMPDQDMVENDYYRGTQSYSKRAPNTEDIEEADVIRWVFKNRKLAKLEEE